MPQDPSTQRPLGAQISHALRARGVDTIFGIPGVHNQEMYRGIEEAGIRHILARHEQGAAFMADGYARATGRLGVCYIITGPGLANAMTPLGQAYSDSVSVLAIASCLHETAARRGQLHQMRDQEGAARTVCAWSETAQSPDAAYGLVDRAFADAAARRKRSMALHVPIPLLEARAPEAPAPLTPPALPSADEASVADLRDLLSASRAPLIIAGGGAVKARVAELATVLGAATFTTYAGGGLVPEHPLDYGSYLARPSSADVIAQADLVIVLGSELAEVDLWRNALGHTAPMIRVDIDP
ncbi:MAG: thiamine pyrophosphate-binding protein, partial [Pseudomonadota bacterium]